MAMTATRGALLLLAVWFCVAESQDAVEPLTLLEVSDQAQPDAAQMSQAISNAEAQSRQYKEGLDEAKADAAIQVASQEATLQQGEKAQAASVAVEEAVADPDDLDTVIKQGLAMEATTAAQNQKLQVELEQEKASKEAIEVKSCEERIAVKTAEIKEKFKKDGQGSHTAQYTDVKYFMYTTLAKQVKAKSQPECEAVCTAQRECKSFTYLVNSRAVGEANQHKCWWSVEKLTYHNDYAYAAQSGTDKSGAVQWDDTPGLKWTTPLSNNAFKVADLGACKDFCLAKGNLCSAVSYKESTGTCIWTAEALPRDEHATYYEKLSSKENTAQADAIAIAQKTIRTECDAQERAEQIVNKKQQEEESRLKAQRRAATLLFTKQMPRPSQKAQLTDETTKAVDKELIKVRVQDIKEKSREQLASTKAYDKKKAVELKQLKSVQDKEMSTIQNLQDKESELKKRTFGLRASETNAQKRTKGLTVELSAVAKAHESAETALLAFTSMQNATEVDPEARATAKEHVMEMKTDLKVAVEGATVAHTKEVASKKRVKKSMKKEATANRNLNRARSEAARQKIANKRAVDMAKKAAHQQEVRMAKNTVALTQGQLGSQKAKELVQKQKYAESVAKTSALEEKINKVIEKHSADSSWHASEEKADQSEELKASKEVNHKAFTALGKLNGKFKKQLGSVMVAKQNYKVLMDADKKKTATDHETADQKIAKVEGALQSESESGFGPM